MPKAVNYYSRTRRFLTIATDPAARFLLAFYNDLSRYWQTFLKSVAGFFD